MGSCLGYSQGMTTQPQVLIVGAGIAGLTLAQALQKRQIPFDLIEKVSGPAPVGAGITLVYNALRLLDALGLGAELRARGQLFDGALIASVSGLTLQQASIPRVQPGAQSLGIHRADLHAVLSRGLPVQWGTSLTALQELSTEVTVTFSSGEQKAYALVVGADGLHSEVRAQVFPPSSPSYAGYTCWRFATNHEFPADPVEWWGQGRRLGITNIGQGRTYGYATLNRPEGVPDAPAGRAGRLRATFQAFPTLATEVLQGLQDDQVMHHDLYEWPQHHWVKGQVALLGDAAHAMTPNMGQGAGMGIEDAIVLAEALRVHGLTERALHAYRAVRQERVKGMADASRLIGLVGQLANPALRSVRDLALHAIPEQLADEQLFRRLFKHAPTPPHY